MMEGYKEFLANQILTEDRLVSYRVLSRSLKVHCSTAQQMLYDFHKFQNVLRPGSVHATYLIYGTRSSNQSDGDVDMAGSSQSPEDEPLAEAVQTTTLSLVEESRLADVLSQYDSVTSIHIYSLGPSPCKDLQLLSELSGQMAGFSTTRASDDTSKAYGTITNPNVKRRTRHGNRTVPSSASAPEPVSSAKSASASTASTNAASKVDTSKPVASMFGAKAGKRPEAKAETSEAPFNAAPASSLPDKKSTPKSSRPGGIMQSFAMAAAKPPKPKPTNAPAPEPALSDDGEDDSDSIPPPKPVEAMDANRKSRKEREDELKRMMEEDDDEGDADENEREQSPEEEVQDEMMEDVPEPEPEEAPEPEPAEVLSSTSNGRRRGRRKVMKKKQVVDEEGYFVTVQEQGWESFSEDEAPVPPKPKSATPTSSAGSAKPKKAGPKSQGSIMSFFTKK